MSDGSKQFIDPYTYHDEDGRNTRVLINRQNIRDGAKWNILERQLSSEAAEDLIRQRRRFDISPQGFRDTHKALFERLYTWAGEDRSMPMGISGTGVRFARPEYVAGELDQLFVLLDTDNLISSSPEQFFARLGEHITKLNAIHPFRDGNGRTMRFHAGQLARQAGCDIDLTKIDRARWIQASAIGFYRGDPRDMTTVLAEAQVSRLAPLSPATLVSDTPEFKRLQQGLYRAGREDPTLPMQIIERERQSHRDQQVDLVTAHSPTGSVSRPERRR